MAEIPEEYRRKALFAALYHHDTVTGRHGGESEGSRVTVEFDATAGEQAMSEARIYVKTVAGALGYSFTSRGPFEAALRPDVEHAIAGLRSI